MAVKTNKQSNDLVNDENNAENKFNMPTPSAESEPFAETDAADTEATDELSADAPVEDSSAFDDDYIVKTVAPTGEAPVSFTDEPSADIQLITGSERSRTRNNAALRICCIALAVLLFISVVFNLCQLLGGDDSGEYPVIPSQSDNTPAVADNDVFPLLASSEEHSLFLYGVRPYGVVLVNNGVGNYFDWLSISDSMTKPQMQVVDIDRDGKSEIVVLLKTMGDDGENQNGVHVLSFQSNSDTAPIYNDAGLDSADTVEKLKSVVDISYDMIDDIFTVRAGGNTASFNDKNASTERDYLTAQLGRSIEFTLSGAVITAIVSVDAVYSDGSIEKIGDITVTVAYGGTALALENVNFVQNQ